MYTYICIQIWCVWIYKYTYIYTYIYINMHIYINVRIYIQWLLLLLLLLQLLLILLPRPLLIILPLPLLRLLILWLALPFISASECRRCRDGSQLRLCVSLCESPAGPSPPVVGALWRRRFSDGLSFLFPATYIRCLSFTASAVVLSHTVIFRTSPSDDLPEREKQKDCIHRD